MFCVVAYTTHHQIYGTPDMARLFGWIMFGCSFLVILWAVMFLKHIKAVEGSYFGFSKKEIEAINEERNVCTSFCGNVTWSYHQQHPFTESRQRRKPGQWG